MSIYVIRVNISHYADPLPRHDEVSDNPPWLISCLESAGCPNPMDLCSDVDNVKACVGKSSDKLKLNQVDPASFLKFILRNCSNTVRAASDDDMQS